MTYHALRYPRLPRPGDGRERKELRASVRETLHAFRPSVSNTAFRIMFLSTVEGQTSPEIGKRLALTPGAVRVSHHAAVSPIRRRATRPGGRAGSLAAAEQSRESPRELAAACTPSNPRTNHLPRNF